MSVSNSSIVHYTRNITNLQGILKDMAFRLKYCVERIELEPKQEPLQIAVPMVSFCDIPFKNVDSHTKEYGGFGIGLKKDWAVRNGLNPVVYIEPKSEVARRLDKLFEVTFSTDKNRTTNTHWGEALDSYYGLMCFMKPYKGNIFVRRDSRELQNYCFYDEREWRYVCLDEERLDHFLLADQYETRKKELNDKAREIKLSFEATDIAYIVVNSEESLAKLVTFIQKETTISVTSICGRIISLEQIRNDF